MKQLSRDGNKACGYDGRVLRTSLCPPGRVDKAMDNEKMFSTAIAHTHRLLAHIPTRLNYNCFLTAITSLKSNTYSEATTQYFFCPSATPFIEASGPKPTIDRTNWYWGKQKINIFMLGIAYEGIAIHLFWTCLPKAGSSNIKEQKKLINRFIKNFGTLQILGLLGEREFGSGGLFKWLNKKKIPFYIRIKEGSITQINKKKLFTAKKIFKALNPKQHTVFNMAVDIPVIIEDACFL